MNTRLLTVLVLTLATCRPLAAQVTQGAVTQPAARQRGPEVVKLTVHPAPPPVPALKWRLIPGAAERKPGNAAQLYLMAMMVLPPIGSERAQSNLVDEVLSTPVDQVTRESCDKIATLARGFEREMEAAARREYCHWELPWEHGLGMMLPYLQHSRRCGQILAASARTQMASGDIDDAINTLGIALKLGSDLGQHAMVVQMFVGAGVTATALRQVQDLVQLPQSPNLYWALAALPRPYFDAATAIDADRRWARDFMLLREASEGRPITAEQLRALLREIRNTYATTQRVQDVMVAEQTGIIGAITGYAQARQYLTSHGMSAQQFEAMNVPTALAKWMYDSYLEAYDDMAKWAYLPPEQRRAGMERAESRLRDLESRNLNPMLVFVTSNSGLVRIAGRTDRHVGMLMALEAIRAYAAGHDGALPAKLADVTETPVPDDPMLERPFDYRVEGNTFVLEAPPPSPSPSDASFGMRFEVMLVSNEPRP